MQVVLYYCVYLHASGFRNATFVCLCLLCLIQLEEIHLICIDNSEIHLERKKVASKQVHLCFEKKAYLNG
jgi:hypothetical protein